MKVFRLRQIQWPPGAWNLLFFSCLFPLLTAAPLVHAVAPDLECQAYLEDYSGAKRHPIHALMAPRKVSELRDIVIQSKFPISVRGGGFSQGGQVIADRGIVIDMKNFDQILEYRPQDKVVRVQAGSTWRKLQERIDADDLSVKVMQTYNNFQIGGALGVNAHGRYVGFGPIISTVRSIRIMLADGQVVEADRERNSDLFYGAIGGYGALGIILDVTLELVRNEKLERVVREFHGPDIVKSVEDYLDYFATEILNDESVMTNADIYPPLYENIRSQTFRRTDRPVTVEERLQPKYKKTMWNALRAVLVSGTHLSTALKWARDRIVDPVQLSQDQVVWRNYEASYDLETLSGVNDYLPWSKNMVSVANQEAILQEYFIPKAHLAKFVGRMKDIFQRHEVNVLNVSIRHVPKNTESVLSWSKEESFALVVYYSQYFGFEPDQEMAKAQIWTQEMLDEVLAVGGSFYLPYQLHARQDQFDAAYVNSNEFKRLKKKFDPERKFSNLLLDRYLADQ